MASPIYSVTCFTRALVSPGYTPQTDERWLDCVWGHYTSQKCAEIAIFRQILDDPDHGNYKVLYEEDIPRLDEEGESEYAWGDSDYEVMRVVVTIKDHGIPVMEVTSCVVKCEPIPESYFELEYPEEFQPVDEEWEQRIDDYYRNGPPSSWEVKLTKEQIRNRSMESYGNTIAMGITTPEQWIYSHQYGWIEKEMIEDYDFARKYAEKIHKYGAKTQEAKGEAASIHIYEVARNISHERDWVFTTQYGWFKKEWATEEPEDWVQI